MSTRKADDSMSKPKPVNQDEKKLDELAQSIWTPEELEEVRRKWDELDLAMEYSSAVDRKEAVRRFLDDQLDAATKGPFKGVSGDFPEEMSGDFVSSAIKEDMLKRILAEVTEQRALVDKLAAKETLEEKIRVVAEGVRQVAAERKAADMKAKTLSREQIEKLFRSSLEGTSSKSKVIGLRYFLDFAYEHEYSSPTQWDKALIASHLEWLASPERNNGKGYTKKTQADYFESVPVVFDVLKDYGVKWPMRKKALIEVQDVAITAPALEASEIKMLINAAKSRASRDDDAAFVALSTVLGLRPDEMSKICHPSPIDQKRDPDDIDYEGKRIFIRQAKGGRQRWQVLPDEIIPYLKRHDFNKKYSAQYITNKMWRRVEKKAGIEHKLHYGFHAVRRSVVTELIATLQLSVHENAEDITHAFLRWKATGRIAALYNKYKPEELDRLVYKYHPLLALWR